MPRSVITIDAKKGGVNFSLLLMAFGANESPPQTWVVEITIPHGSER